MAKSNAKANHHHSQFQLSVLSPLLWCSLFSHLSQFQLSVLPPSQLCVDSWFSHVATRSFPSKKVPTGFPSPQDLFNNESGQGRFLRRYTNSSNDNHLVVDPANQGLVWPPTMNLQVPWTHSEPVDGNIANTGVGQWRLFIKPHRRNTSIYQHGDFVCVKSKHNGQASLRRTNCMTQCHHFIITGYPCPWIDGYLDAKHLRAGSGHVCPVGMFIWFWRGCWCWCHPLLCCGCHLTNTHVRAMWPGILLRPR